MTVTLGLARSLSCSPLVGLMTLEWFSIVQVGGEGFSFSSEGQAGGCHGGKMLLQAAAITPVCISIPQDVNAGIQRGCVMLGSFLGCLDVVSREVIFFMIFFFQYL
jgi:hypothetical protein